MILIIRHSTDRATPMGPVDARSAASFDAESSGPVVTLDKLKLGVSGKS